MRNVLPPACVILLFCPLFVFCGSTGGNGDEQEAPEPETAPQPDTQAERRGHNREVFEAMRETWTLAQEQSDQRKRELLDEVRQLAKVADSTGDQKWYRKIQILDRDAESSMVETDLVAAYYRAYVEFNRVELWARANPNDLQSIIAKWDEYIAKHTPDERVLEPDFIRHALRLREEAVARTHGPASAVGRPHGYREDTLSRFRHLLDGEGWTAADPPRNQQGMLEAVHAKTGLTFVLIPAGSFRMGSPETEEGRDDDEDLHSVRIRRPFLLCVTECTQRAWEKGGGKNDSYFRGADRPVEQVSWTMCRDWCAGNGLRLPSGDEFEYACRAGTPTPLPTGDTITTDQASYSGKEPYGDGPKGVYRRKTVEAGSLPANPWGLHEMHENVVEWCEDWDGSAQLRRVATSMMAPVRFVRGGNWWNPAHQRRSAARDEQGPTWVQFDMGFRPAADLPPLKKPDDDK